MPESISPRIIRPRMIRPLLAGPVPTPPPLSRPIRRTRFAALAAVPLTLLLTALGAVRAPVAAAAANPGAAGKTAAHTVTGTAYVADTRSGTLSAIDLATGKVAATLPATGLPDGGQGIGAHPTAVAASADGAQIYVLSTQGAQQVSTLTVVSAASGAVVATIPLPGTSGYADMTVSPHGGPVYLLRQDLGTVVIVNPATHHVGTMPLTGHDGGFVLSRDGSALYAFNGSAPLVAKYDTATRKRLAVFHAGRAFIQQILLSPDGSQLYVAHFGRVLRIIDTATGATAAHFPLGPSGFSVSKMALSADGAALYAVGRFHNITGQAFAVNTATHAISAAIPLSREPNAAVLSPDGKQLFINGRHFGKVTIVDTAAWKVSATLQDWTDGPIVFSPVGAEAYVADDNAVDVVDTATGTVTDRLNTGLLPNAVAFGAGGTRVFVVNGGSDTLSIVDAASGQILKTVHGGMNAPDQIALAPDGSTAYVGGTGDSIVKVRLATGKVAAVIPVGGDQLSIALSPDGGKLYVAEGIAERASRVAVVDTRTDAVTAAIPVAPAPGKVVFSADGSRAYVPSTAVGKVDVIDTATETVAATIAAGQFVDCVTLSPDGSKAYVADDSGLAVVDTATNTVTATVQIGARLTAVVASADGSTVYTADGTTVFAISTATDRVRASAPFNLAIALALAPGGAALYALNATGSLAAINTAAFTVTATATAGGSGASELALSRDGSQAYVVHDYFGVSEYGTVSVVDTSTDTVTGTVTVGLSPSGFAIAP
jgi:YVTN family beta-propeller protein